MLINQQSQESKSNRVKLSDLYVATPPLDVANKIIIDIQDVIDFSFCPFYYDLKNKDSNEINRRVLYDESLHKTFYAYLIALQEDKLNSTLEFLKYRWGKEWIKYKYKSTRDFVITCSSYRNDTYENLRKKGIEAIFKFNDMMMKEKQYPIIIGHKYQIEILPNIILTGTFEYIRELTLNNGQKVIQLVKFISETNRFNTNLSKRYNLELIAMSYAFKELFNVDYFQVVSIEVETKRMLVQTYTDKEYDLLKNTVKNVVLSIQNDIKCISPDKRCFHCEYRNVCINTL